MMRYELLEHTADAMIRATGESMEEAFGNAAYAMFDQIVDASTIEAGREIEVAVEGDDIEELLYDLLSELLYVHDVESVVLSEFDVEFVEGGVRCRARGEALDLGKHRPKAEIKAVTYHMLSVDRERNEVTVIFDV